MLFAYSSCWGISQIRSYWQRGTHLYSIVLIIIYECQTQSVISVEYY